MASKRQLRIPIAALLILFGLALDSMWGLIHRNGYYEFLRNIRDKGPRVLPGSDNLIRAKYTGVGLLDYWMAVMNTVLANVTDGSAIHLSLYAFQFAGQLGSITTILMIEEICQGHTLNPLKWFFPWGLAMTAFGYAVIMPLYAIVHLFVSPTAQLRPSRRSAASESDQIDYSQTYSLPGSIVFGYIVPTVMMSLPTAKTDQHQFFVGIWHLFPLWVSLAQILLHSFRRLAIAKHAITHKAQQSKEEVLETMSWKNDCLRRAYNLAGVLSATTHVGTLLIILYANILPQPRNEELSLSGVFMPLPRSYEYMKSFVKGTLDLLQYDQYIGSLAAIVWAISVEHIVSTEVRTKLGWVRLSFETALISVLLGPATAIAAIRRRTQISTSEK